MNPEVAYAMTKVEAKRYVYAEAPKHGFEVLGGCPCHVIGPLLSASHQRPWVWQTRKGDMRSTLHDILLSRSRICL